MRCLPLLALLLASAAFPAWARGTIERVDIRGLENHEAMEQNVRLALGVNSEIGKVQGESRLEFLLLNAEREARQALEPFGYYSPTITVDSPRDANDRIVVTVHVDRGKPVRVRDANVGIVGPGGEDQYLERDLDAFRPRQGEVLDHPTYDASRDGISRRLAERGYFDADFMEREVRVTRADFAADIDLVWDSGFRYDMGPTVFHQDFFRPGLLEKLVTWDEGSYFHQGKLDRLRQSLVKLDYFSAIDIQPRPQDADDDFRVPVDVNLVLANRTVYTAGLSYGSESGMGVRFGMERRYVNDRGHKLVTDLDYAQKRKNLLVQYRIPAFAWLDGWYTGAFSAYDEQTDYIDLRNVRLLASRSGELTERWTAVGSIIALRERWSYDMDVDTGQRLYTYSTLFYPEVTGNYIGVDNRLFPRHGLSLGLALRGGAEGVGSDTSFVQGWGSATWFQGVGEADRLILRGEAGATWTSDLIAMPPSLRFFAGGDRSIRGYAWREVGPRTPPPDNFALGGRYVLTGSVEYEHYFNAGPWGMAAFVDGGDAFDDDFDLHLGVGIGARWRSPIGGVRIDIARGLNDPDSGFQIYLSLGANL
ncbi:autotransporter assembly complex protein TamA [Pseudoxanthomonas suwonensis]|uniref:Translocation and assembly module subunit TamA n=1 Tax=Pseudoxanthomonas suwonensis TaxID=314722 RepID=A0A0E3UN24_9GAMM|nr:autotransporter assembly complex family protein [Pseudoxanthomonas suwonensis]AKC86826.1 membrane protein [Pseudoxanthomonas suwonensis]